MSTRLQHSVLCVAVAAVVAVGVAVAVHAKLSTICPAWQQIFVVEAQLTRQN